MDHWVAVPGDAAVPHAQAGQPTLDALSPGSLQRRLADEVFAEADGPLQGGLERIGLCVHVHAVQPHPGLQPEGVARAQSRRLQPVTLARLEQRCPKPGSFGIAAEELEAVLAGIAGPGEAAGMVIEPPL